MEKKGVLSNDAAEEDMKEGGGRFEGDDLARHYPALQVSMNYRDFKKSVER